MRGAAAGSLYLNNPCARAGIFGITQEGVGSDSDSDSLDFLRPKLELHGPLCHGAPAAVTYIGIDKQPRGPPFGFPLPMPRGFRAPGGSRHRKQPHRSNPLGS